MEQLLLGQGVYSHVSNGTNPFDYVKYASNCPCPLIPAAPTATEQEAIKAWFKDDGLVKSIVLRKINSSVLSLIPDDVSITISKLVIDCTVIHYFGASFTCLHKPLERTLQYTFGTIPSVVESLLRVSIHILHTRLLTDTL